MKTKSVVWTKGGVLGQDKEKSQFARMYAFQRERNFCGQLPCGSETGLGAEVEKGADKHCIHCQNWMAQRTVVAGQCDL